MLPRRFDTLLHCFCWTLFTWNLQPRGNSTFSRNVIMRQVQPSSRGEATLGQWLWQIHCQSQLLTLWLVQVWRWASPSSSLQMPGPSYSWRASQPGLPELHKDSTNSIGLWNWKLKAIENRGQCNLVSEERHEAKLAHPSHQLHLMRSLLLYLQSDGHSHVFNSYSKRHTKNIRTTYKQHKKYMWRKNMLAQNNIRRIRTF